jgi:uncharacterized protein YprB with RNaseH-like and TPR domain
MLNKIDVSKVLFLDIETVPISYKFSDLEEKTQHLWDKKTKYLQERDKLTVEDLYEKAGIYAEFGKIICISVGFLVQVKGEAQIRLKSFANKNEKLLLQEFLDLLNSYYNHEGYILCAHNGKEFDYPYISRRLLINGLNLPKLLNNAGKKPWEINNIDTLELWKFGDYKHYTSLDLLTHIFNIPTPKDDIDGSQVAEIFYEDDDLDRIIKYCEKDVVAMMQLFRKYRGEELIDGSFVIST